VALPNWSGPSVAVPFLCTSSRWPPVQSNGPTGHGGPPEERKAVYDISNTLARVKNIKTPLLVMHGEADVRAPFHQFEMVVKILTELHKPFESKTYPNEPHGFRVPANRLDMNRRLEAFLDKHLKGGPPSTQP